MIRNSDGAPVGEVEIGALLRGLRERRLLTQEQLAERSGLNVRTIRRLEALRSGRPRSSSLGRLVEALELTEAELASLTEAFDGAGSPLDSGPEETAEPVRLRPAQLPATGSGFAGRVAPLRQLDALLPGCGGAHVCVVTGTAGVGKTTLAVHWAQQAAPHFPDGQLYADLGGFGPDPAAVPPSRILAGFLAALGQAPPQIPVGLTEQTAMFRSLLAGRRLLLLLDNARDADQVRPLLPGPGACRVVVTSRDRLTDLVVGGGADQVGLDLLAAGEARELLEGRLGAPRVVAEPAAVDEIIARCARLPLALTVVAARAAAHPQSPLAAFASELGRAYGTLDDGGPATRLRAVFTWSYRALRPPERRMFRLLGLHPGPDVTVAAAASLAGSDLPRAAALLRALADTSLLSEHTLGRYTTHDLLRAYAMEQRLTTAARLAALTRLLDHLLHTACAADRLLDPYRRRIEPASPSPGADPEPVQNTAEALAWFTAERPVLLAAVGHAAAHGLPRQAWQLAWATATFLTRQGYWLDLIEAQQTALRAATQAGDRLGQAHAHRGIAPALHRLGRYADAEQHLHQAQRLYGEAGDRVAQAYTHLNLADVYGSGFDRPADAVRHGAEAVALFAAVGDQVGQARALANVAWYRGRLGDFAGSLECSEEALALHTGLGDRFGQASAWESLGTAHRSLGAFERAVACYRESLELLAGLADRHYEASVLTELGTTHREAGDTGAAHRAWRKAIAILDELGHPDVDKVRELAAPH